MINEAVILCGGFGTRIKTVLGDTPKSLAPINGRPFLFYLLDKLVDSKIKKVVLSTHYQSESIKSVVGHYYNGMDIVYSYESEPLGTGGAFKLALNHVAGDAFLAMNGDDWVGVSFDSLIHYYDYGISKGMIVVKYITDASRYGTIEFNRDTYQVYSFNEKGKSGEGYINTGVYILHKDLFTKMKQTDKFSIEYEGFPHCTGDLGAYMTGGDFIDIGTPESYEEAQKIIGV